MEVDYIKLKNILEEIRECGNDAAEGADKVENHVKAGLMDQIQHFKEILQSDPDKKHTPDFAVKNEDVKLEDYIKEVAMRIQALGECEAAEVLKKCAKRVIQNGIDQADLRLKFLKQVTHYFTVKEFKSEGEKNEAKEKLSHRFNVDVKFGLPEETVREDPFFEIPIGTDRIEVKLMPKNPEDIRLILAILKGFFEEDQTIDLAIKSTLNEDGNCITPDPLQQVSSSPLKNFEKHHLGRYSCSVDGCGRKQLFGHYADLVKHLRDKHDQEPSDGQGPSA